MKRTIFILLAMLFLGIFNSNLVLAHSQGRPIVRDWGEWNLRAKLLVHNSLAIGSGLERRYHIVIPDAFNSLDCKGFVGLNMQAEAFGLEPALGWDFGVGELITSLRWSLETESFYHWADIEYQPESEQVYGFAQFQKLVNRGFDYGIEADGFLTNSGLEEWGFGPNARFHMRAAYHHEAKMDIEFAIYLRQLEDDWRPEIYVRFHFIPKLEDF
ncbi:MAG: hypothetical protein Q8O32_03390 [bacterium]|nr:hypothetical protein [bacterium]